MSSKVHAKELPWPRITKVLSSTPKQVRAAVAYLGVDAPEIMPLKRGDVLICDASKGAIKSGSTSAKAIQKYMRQGVVCYSCTGLHAKLILLPTSLFVGSANASANSRDHLVEAVLETTDKASLKTARKFVDSLAVERSKITKEQLKALLNLPVRPSIYKPSREVLPTSTPLRVNRLWIIFTNFSEVSNAYENARLTTLSNVSRSRNESYKGCRLIDSGDWNENIKNLRLGDWVIEILHNRVKRPKVVIGIVPVSKASCLIWSAQPKDGPQSVKLVDYLQLVDTPNLVELADNARDKTFGFSANAKKSLKYLKPFKA